LLSPVAARLSDSKGWAISDVADDVVQLQIHLVQRLLHVLHMGGRHLYKALPMAQ
jgi:hypothetical protein